MVGPLIVSTLLVGPGDPVLQRPSADTSAEVSPQNADPDPPTASPPVSPSPDEATPEPELAPVEPEPVPLDPEPDSEPESEPTPEPEPPPPSEIFELEEPTPAPALTLRYADPNSDWRRDYVRVREPEYRGTGMMVTGIVAFGALGLMQTVWTGLCGDPYCDMPAIHQRSLIAGGLAFTSGGAWKRGQWDAYRDTLAGTPLSTRRVRDQLIAGWTLAAAGLFGLGVDFALHTECVTARRGPYAEDAPGDDAWFGPDCKGVESAIVMNLSAAASAIGLGFGLHAAKYKRDRKFYRRARIAMVPNLGRDRLGVGIAGEF